MPDIVLKTDTRTASLLVHSLAASLKRVRAEMTTLMMYKQDGGLSPVNQVLLPAAVMAMTHEEIIEQVNPWISLEMCYSDLLNNVLHLIEDAEAENLKPKKGEPAS